MEEDILNYSPVYSWIISHLKGSKYRYIIYIARDYKSLYTYLQYIYNTIISKQFFSADLRIIQEPRKKLKGGRRASKKKLNI